MKSNSHIFDLIHSLQPAERKYHVKTSRAAKGKGPHQYVDLFRAIEQQDSFDEAALKQQFAGTSFEKSLAFPKTYLYNQVLRSMGQFHYEKSPSRAFRSTLDKIEFLLDRGLTDQAQRLLEKVLPQAQRYEQPFAVLQFLRWQRRSLLRRQTGDITARLEEMDATEAHWEAALHHEQATLRLHDDLYAAVQAFRRKSRPDTSPDLQAFRQRLDHCATLEPLIFGAQVALQRARAHFHYMNEDFARVHDAYQAEVALWEAHPHQIAAEPLRFVRLYGQWLSSKALLRDYNQLLAEIARLRAKDLDRRGRAEVFQITSNLELFYHINAGRSAEALPLIPAIEAGLREFKVFLLPSAQLGFFFNLALVGWTARRYRMALRWVHRILQFEAGDVRQDIRLVAPLLEKILYFELGEVGLLESWFRSFGYRRRTRRETDAVEGMLVELIREVLAEPDAREHPAHFEAFGEALDRYVETPGVSRVGLQELKQWVAWKVGGPSGKRKGPGP